MQAKDSPYLFYLLRRSFTEGEFPLSRSFSLGGFFVVTLVCCLLLLPEVTFAGVVTKPENNLGLVGYWTFNDDGLSTVIDYSGNSNTGTLTNMDTGSDYVSGYKSNSLALDFDGTDDYINIADSSELDVTTGSVTISAWYKISNCSVSKSMVTKDRSGSGVKPNYVFYGGNSVQFGVSDGSTWNTFVSSSGHTCSTSNWVHAVGVHDRAAGVATLYINGTANNTDETPGDGYNSTGDLHLSHREDDSESGPGDTPEYFPGSVDDIRIYSRALSASEVAHLYSRSATFKQPSNKNLVGYWSFEDATGTRATDFSGNGNNGTLTNMDANTDWVDGRVGKALDFDGTNEYVTIADASNLKATAGGLTVAFWINKSSHTNYAGFVDKYSSNCNNHDWFIGDNATGGGFYAGLYGSSCGGGISRTSSATITLNEWHHITMTYDGGTSASGVHIYVDGVLSDGSSSGSFSAPQGGATDIRIGHDHDDDSYLNGQLDEVRIYNTALSASQIQNLYQNSKKTTLQAPQNNKITDGLVGYWTFNGKDLTTTTATDVSGNGNHGTLTNGPVPAQGKVGQALLFDGSDDYITRSAITDATDNITISAWVYPEDIDGVIMENGFVYQDAERGFLFRTGVAGDLQWCSNDFTGNYNKLCTATSTGRIVTDEWQHIVIAKTGTTVNFYINGQDAGGGTIERSAITYGSNMYIGECTVVFCHDPTWLFGDNGYWNGRMDELRMYDRTLTVTEITRLYNMGR